MSNFGNTLKQLIEVKQTSQSALSRMAGLSQAHISKLINGDQVWISAEDLERICSTIAPDEPHLQARLVYAHLLDECHGPGSDLIKISIQDGLDVLKESAPPYAQALPKKFEEALEILKASAHDKDLRDLIESLAALLSKGK